MNEAKVMVCVVFVCMLVGCATTSAENLKKDNSYISKCEDYKGDDQKFADCIESKLAEAKTNHEKRGLREDGTMNLKSRAIILFGGLAIISVFSMILDAVDDDPNT